MNIPKQIRPIIRGCVTAETDPNGVVAQACTGVPSGTIGACFGNNGPIPGRWNCSACCALRGAISWQGGGIAAAC